MPFIRYTLLTALFGAMAASLPAADQTGQAGIPKRQTQITKLTLPQDALQMKMRFMGGNKIKLIQDATALEMAIGNENAAALTNKIDWASQKIAVVSWMTSGPPDGVLKWELQADGDKKQIVFYVSGPPAGAIRGMRAGMRVDFYLVPKAMEVSIEAKERPAQ